MNAEPTTNEAGYCKVFVDGISRDDVLVLVVSRLKGRRSASSVETAELVVHVRNNDKGDASRANEAPDGFLLTRVGAFVAGLALFWPVFLDIEPAEDVDRDSYVQNVGGLLDWLWAEGRRAIAACDFEDELARRGGYSSVGLT